MSAIAYSIIKSKTLKSLHDALQTKETQIASAATFIKEIEKGNLDAGYKADEAQIQSDALASSLISMRDQMKKFSQEEKQRNWATEGLAKFVDILRSKNSTLAELSDSILNNLVKYIGANQGALYLINDDEPQDVHLEMKACYAYNRKKHLIHRIELGQGITGQAALEKNIVYMTEVPKDFIRITSGLGDAPPRNIIVVPLVVEDKVFGVIELASFDTIKAHQRTFVEKLGESIASTIASVKTNEHTKHLLEETQLQAEQMRAQEEEVKQNLEELSATQEEMHRILKEVQGKERYMNELIDSGKDSILTLDRNYKVVHYNKTLAASYNTLGFQIEKGFEMKRIFNDEEWQKFKTHYDRALQGESFEITEHYHSHGLDSYFITNYSPLRDEKGEIIAAAIFAKDTTALIKAQRETERLLQESKNQQVYYNDVIEGISDSVLTVDLDFKIVVANSAFKKIFSQYGVSVEPGSSLLSMSKKENQDEFKKPYLRAMAGEHVEEPHRHHFDRDFTVSYNPLKNTAGEIIGVSLIAHDTTERLKLQKKTEQLLNDAQQQTEELKSQEEEIRQNIEELSATQDEMQRVLSLVQEKETYVSNIINLYTDTILTIDLDCKIVLFNTFLAKTFAVQGLIVEKGMDVFMLSHPEKIEESKANYKRVFAGETIVENHEYFGKQYEITTTPLRDKEENITGATIFTKDISNSISLLKQAQQQTEEVRSQEEELRQTMEEMQAIHEELSRKNDEIERVRKQEQDHANTILVKFRKSEEAYKARIAELESKLQMVSN